MLRGLLIGPGDSLSRQFLDSLGGLDNFELCHRTSGYLPAAELLALLEQAAPEVVVINMADYDRATRLISRLVPLRPDLPIIALHTDCDQRVLLELMQLGARELWFPPFNPDQMRQTINRLGQQAAAAPARERLASGGAPIGDLIAFLPARGGCGASTIALHTAMALVKLKGPVLFADFDFHNSIIAFWLKITPRHGFLEALERAHWLDSAQWDGLIGQAGPLDVLTAPQTGRPMVFSGDETSAVLDYARRNYRFVLVDLPDSIYTSCWEVLDQANPILLVSTPEMASLYLARRKVSQLVDHGISRDRVRVLLSRSTQIDMQPNEVEKFLSLRVTANFGNHYRAVTSAFADGSVVAAASKLGVQFTRFAESLAGPPEGKEKKTGGWKIRQIFSSAST